MCKASVESVLKMKDADYALLHQSLPKLLVTTTKEETCEVVKRLSRFDSKSMDVLVKLWEVLYHKETTPIGYYKSLHNLVENITTIPKGFNGPSAEQLKPESYEFLRKVWPTVLKTLMDDHASRGMAMGYISEVSADLRDQFVLELNKGSFDTPIALLDFINQYKRTAEPVSTDEDERNEMAE